MKSVRFLAMAAIALAVSTASLAQGAADKPGDKPAEQVDMAAMMERARKYTKPGKSHEQLKRVLGTWDTETRMIMDGKLGDAEKGTMTCKWLMEGRWVQCDLDGQMMGRPFKGFYVMGYDNFKQSYVTVALNNFDTAMFYSEGDMDPGGKAIIAYGTLDEYMTGELGKMVKSVWRFVSDDEMKHEVHDLPIGENNTEVFEVSYKRRVEK